jgi:Na+/H+ antiporter NhaD/arsenite permease-like protein
MKPYGRQLTSSITMFLNLDTTAVLVTLVMLALAPKVRIVSLPLAMTTVLLANTASLLLPHVPTSRSVRMSLFEG